MTVVDDQAQRIGATIRELRRSRGLTLVQLADRTGLSHPFLSQLERGHARPSMVSLERIALALDTSQVQLLAAGAGLLPDGEPTAEIMRREEGVRGPFSRGEARLLVRSPRSFQPLEFVGANLDPGDFYVHREDEFLYVVAGLVRLDLDGSPSILEPGDSAYYPGGTRHRWGSGDGAEYRLVVVKQATVRQETP